MIPERALVGGQWEFVLGKYSVSLTDLVDSQYSSLLEALISIEWVFHSDYRDAIGSSH